MGPERTVRRHRGVIEIHVGQPLHAKPFHQPTGPDIGDGGDRMDRVAGKIGPAPRDARLGGFARIARAPCIGTKPPADLDASRSEEHTSELQSLMSISYAVFCLKKKNTQ